MSTDGDWLREELGRALAVLRVANGLNQDEVAQASGVPSSTISDYERGKVVPGLRTLQKLLSSQGLSLAAIQEAQGLIECVRRERLGASQQRSGGTGEHETLGLAGAPLALRREIERIAGTTGKSLAQLIRLTLLLLCANPDAASTARSSEDSCEPLPRAPKGVSEGGEEKG